MAGISQFVIYKFKKKSMCVSDEIWWCPIDTIAKVNFLFQEKKLSFTNSNANYSAITQGVIRTGSDSRTDE